jgi:hypothetical protein
MAAQLMAGRAAGMRPVFRTLCSSAESKDAVKAAKTSGQKGLTEAAKGTPSSGVKVPDLP